MSSERKALKFASGPQTTLAVASKSDSLSATVRYDDDKDISEGDEIDCLAANSHDVVATATVEYTDVVPVRKALDVVALHWAEYGIETPDRLVSTLNSYYDDTITMATDVKVLILDPEVDDAA